MLAVEVVEGLAGGLGDGASSVFDGSDDLIADAFVGEVGVAGGIAENFFGLADELAASAADAGLGAEDGGVEGGVFDGVRAGGVFGARGVDDDVGNEADANCSEEPGECFHTCFSWGGEMQAVASRLGWGGGMWFVRELIEFRHL